MLADILCISAYAEIDQAQRKDKSINDQAIHYQNALNQLIEAVNHKHSTAATVVGSLYFNGRPGIPKNLRTAESYFSIAAERGDEKGHYGLFKILQKSNPQKALRHLTISAEKGFAIGQCDLGKAYLAGHITTQNHEQALHWLHEASSYGVAEAYYHKGMIYLQGQGVKQDLTQALIWFNHAVRNGMPSARLMMAALYLPTLLSFDTELINCVAKCQNEAEELYNPIEARKLLHMARNEGVHIEEIQFKIADNALI